MPNLTPHQIHQLGNTLLQAAGASSDEAHTVMTHVVNANLAGHDSHGIMLLPWYLESIKKGHIVPGASIEVEHETPTTARINGNWGFGYVVTTQAMEMAIAKAKAQNVAAITIYQQGHVGRLVGYALMPA